MALEFSRCVEELVATRVFITSTEGFVDISSLGSQGEGGLVSVGARTIRLDSDGGQVSIGHGEGGGGAISARASGDGATIVLGVPGTAHSAHVSLSGAGLTLVYGPPANPGTIRMLGGSIEMEMGTGGGRVVVSDDSVTLQVGGASLTLTAEGLVARHGGKSRDLSPAASS